MRDLIERSNQYTYGISHSCVRSSSGREPALGMCLYFVNDGFQAGFNLRSAGTVHKLIKIIVLFPFTGTSTMVSPCRQKQRVSKV